MRNLTLISLFVLLWTKSFSQNPSVPQLGKNTIKEVIGAMTLEEKVKLLVGNGFRRNGPATGPTIGVTQDKVPGAAGTTFAIPRLGIPSLVLSDGPAGVRISPYRNKDSSKSYFATAFPIGTLLASSWDTSLVRKVGVSFGQEIKEYGIDIILAPALNIHRNPLGGRNFEYYSEDPLIAGSMTSAIVNGIQSNGVGTSIKHFVANNSETNRNTINTVVSERALREIYLKGFEIAVKKSNPWTVMSSYNLLNGTYTSERYDLLTTLLRKEWGFKGFVMTDWFGGKNPIEQMKAGNDVIMPGTTDQSKAILSAAMHDSLSVQVIDENVERVLNIILLSPAFKNYAFSNTPDLKANAQVSRMASAEGMILLKNQSETLPVKANKRFAILGNTAYDLIAGGTGSGDVNKAYTVNLVEGLKNAGMQLDEGIIQDYTLYLKDAKAKRPKRRSFFEVIPPIEEMKISDEKMEALANNNDYVIFTLGRNAGEGADRKVENDFNLSISELEILQKASKAFHAKGKKVIMVLNIGGVVETKSWTPLVDATLLAWQPGIEGGNAIADVLSGKVNPSGKLATTFPVNYGDAASSKNFPGKEFPEKAVKGMFGRMVVPAEITYEEGIYVGYRYFSSFHIKPSYEFGYGLSYTQFAYSKPVLSSKEFKDPLMVNITITNTGKTAGKEVVQLYLSAPHKNLEKPAMELKGFGKTHLLAPGESETLKFPLYAADLASFDTKSESWIAESGTYTIKIGASSENIKQVEKFNLNKDILIEKVNKILSPQVEIHELKTP